MQTNLCVFLKPESVMDSRYNISDKVYYLRLVYIHIDQLLNVLSSKNPSFSFLMYIKSVTGLCSGHLTIQ